jgi:hypothetical protein
MSKECRVQISRGVGWTDKYCSYVVYIDDKEMVRLKQGDCITIFIAPGNHEMVLKIPWSWHRSNKITFDAVEGQKIDFTCKSIVTGWKLILTFFYAVFCFNRYIVLEKTS